MAIIYLIGPRGSGKTTVGHALADSLSAPFRDLDASLCESEGKTVAQIVAESGWDEFRRLESAALRQETEDLRARGADDVRHAVVATGGGVVLDKANREFMNDTGIVIWLNAPCDTLARRLGSAPEANQRPSLTGAGLLEEISQIVAAREPLYAACANHKIDGARDVAEICEDILGRIR